MNPVGTFRTAARHSLVERAAAVMTQLDGFLSAARQGRAQPQQLRSALDALAGESATHAAELQSKVQQVMSAGRLDAQINLGEQLRRGMLSDMLWQRDLDCTSSLITSQITNSVNVQNVGVYVGNLHNINVNVSSCPKEIERHAVPLQDVINQNVSIRNTLVAVHTVDNVRVGVNGFALAWLLESSLKGSGSPAPAEKWKAVATSTTVLKKKLLDSSLLAEKDKCTLKSGFAIGFVSQRDAGQNHVELKVDIPSSGCPTGFFDGKPVFVFKPHFRFEPR